MSIAANFFAELPLILFYTGLLFFWITKVTLVRATGGNQKYQSARSSTTDAAYSIENVENDSDNSRRRRRP